jgi:hypothetical protein
MAEDPVPPGLRASDADRENVLGILKHNSAAGRLSHDTFLHRMEQALEARGVAELAELVHDLPSPAPRRERAMRAVRWWLTVSSGVRQAWRAPRQPRLILPRDDRVYVIGRSPECDRVLWDETVSRHHAELRRSAGNWVLADLGSTNGTYVNGWRVRTGLTVQAGDLVRFGRARFRVTD